MTALYENDTFRFEKEQNEKQIIESAESRLENKNFLDQMDTYLKDLQSWRLKREPSAKQIEDPTGEGSPDEPAFDEQSMKEA